MQQIIALWTHPRSVSTALERVMMERGDLKVLHEPFSYLYYVESGKATIPQEYEDPNHPRTYDGIKDFILGHGETEPVFFKDMCAHCHERLPKDDEFLNALANTFLIRDPARAIPSFYALNPDVTLDEIGYEHLVKVFQKAEKLKGKAPIVIDATDLENDPEGIVAAYCDALGIPFIPESLTWEPDHKPEWEIWKTWHKDAAQTTGIRKNVETFEVTVDNSDHLKSYYDYHFPFYESLHIHRIRSKKNG